ncbi:NaeI family type II restriction endonuclease [Streptomyces sp. CB02261]|uniref:NaeI family type II restriction endonuclease n=1 Tax=Streptomyces sp. CB02261 TaxID=1703940 RepID=UPI0009A0C8F1|nr:NaeI family type II restriction endonuclease [Streptomyces sp. CB02261]
MTENFIFGLAPAEDPEAAAAAAGISAVAASGSPASGNRVHDPDLETVFSFFMPSVAQRMGVMIRRATDEVIATPRTRRWTLDQCNDQEKAYLGVNIENIVRQECDLAEGKHGMDFDVMGVDVDCKWSRTFGGWQIPPQAVGHICLLVHGDDVSGQMAVGLLRIRPEILVGGNRDLKRTIQSPGGMSEIRWLVPPKSPLPDNFLMSLRKQDRDAIIAPRGGNERAYELFKRCEGMIIYRHAIESIGQQVDDARRFRGETRKKLEDEGFEVLNGHWKAHRERAWRLGKIELTSASQWVCLRTDGSSPARRAALEPGRREESLAYRKFFSEQIAAERKAIKKAQKAARAAAAQGSVSSVIPDENTEFVKQAVVKAEKAAVERAASLPPG